MNASTNQLKDSEKFSHFFHLLGQPARLNILLAIGEHEVCVCHLEVLLKERQAYISQQLMLLKEGGLIECRREGRNIYYRLTNKDLLNFLQTSMAFTGLPLAELDQTVPITGCPCPKCTPGVEECPPEF